MKNLGYLAVLLLAAITLVYCEKTKISHDGPAKFVLKNITTGEEKTFEGIELGYNSPLLVVRNNDSLQVKFVPELEYVKHGFEVTFSLFNDETIKDYEYPYLYKLKVEGITPGSYTFSCLAIVNSGDVNIREQSLGQIEVAE